MTARRSPIHRLCPVSSLIPGLLVLVLLLSGCGGGATASGSTGQQASGAPIESRLAAGGLLDGGQSSGTAGSVTTSTTPTTALRSVSPTSLNPTAALAQMTSPSNGSSIGINPTFTWTSGSNNTQFWLAVGSAAGQADLFNQSVGTSTSQGVSNLPAGNIYVRLWSLCGGAWQYIDYTYSTGAWAAAQMTTPANGANLSGVTTFTWSGGQDNAEFFLGVGTQAAANDLYYASVGTATSATVTSLPSNATPIYVRLWSRNGQVWKENDYTYTTGTWTLAQVTSPAPGTTIAATSTPFTWSSGAANAAYWLQLGTTPGGDDLLNANMGTSVSQTVSGLPAGAVYARLWSLSNGVWLYVDYAYTTGSWVPAQMLTPVNGASLAGSTTFTWTAGNDNLEYFLGIGTTPGGQDILYASQGTATSSTVNNVPSVSGPLYVRLWSRSGSTWSENDYTYSTGGWTLAQMTSPTGGATISNSTSFTWNSGGGNTAYWLSVGSTPGGTDIFNASEGTATSQLVSNLPAGSIYVRLWSLRGNTWMYVDYVYSTGAWVPASLTAPVNGSTIAGSSTTFSWNAGTNNAEYWLSVGTTAGGQNVLNVSEGAATSATVSGLPSGPVFVTLWSRSGGQWQSLAYTYESVVPSPSPSPSPSPTPVPSPYQSLFNAIVPQLNTFTNTINGMAKGTTPPRLYTVLINADSNAVYNQLAGAGSATVAAMAQNAVNAAAALQKNFGVQGVVISICYPTLVKTAANLPNATFNTNNYATYLSYYQQVVAGVRKLGLDVEVETNIVLPEFAGINYQGMTLPIFTAGTAEVAQNVIDNLRPDILNIANEPSTLSVNTGLTTLNTPAGYASFVANVRAAINNTNSPSTRFSAGSSDWFSSSFITSLLASTRLDMYSLHLYQPDNLQVGISQLQQLATSGKPLLVTENFLNKQNAAVDGTNQPIDPQTVYIRNAYSFWAPLDAQYATSILALGKSMNMQSVAFWDTDWLYSYIDYSSTTGSYTYTQMQQAVAHAVSAARAAGTFSPFGAALRSFRGLP